MLFCRKACLKQKQIRMLIQRMRCNLHVAKRLVNCYRTNSNANNYVYIQHMQHEIRCNVYVHPIQSSQLYPHAI